MKQKFIRLYQRYATALGKYLNGGPRDLRPAVRLGREAVALGWETLELARIHEQALTTPELSKSKNGLIERAAIFFTEAIAPIVETHCAARQSKNELNRLNGTLHRRTAELAATNRLLQRGIAQRKSVEAALRKSGEHYARLLKESLKLRERLQQFMHQVLTAQEDERKKISRELQNEIAQTLLGINVRLLSLRREARNDSSGFKDEIAGTQRLVAKSAKFVLRFARELNNRDTLPRNP
ncbi:MAG TPA: hypothetical protein VGY56_22175 [Verrucomicrobiae bacterium]|nr:hypothetical protein [Verrucomicrobiae bacterium]